MFIHTFYQACQTEAGLSDVAAVAEQFQPKGITLATTEVKTKVPFLLKHKLREYQHIGLDWLVAMHEKRLNGILADEMGLGEKGGRLSFMLAHTHSRSCKCGCKHSLIFIVYFIACANTHICTHHRQNDADHCSPRSFGL